MCIYIYSDETERELEKKKKLEKAGIEGAASGGRYCGIDDCRVGRVACANSKAGKVVLYKGRWRMPLLLGPV